MLVRVKSEDVAVLRQLAVETYGETFGEDIPQADLEHFYAHDLSEEELEKSLAQPESATYFVLHEGQPVGFLKVNWGQAQTEQELENAFEIQKIYILKSHQGFGLGKEMFEFALNEAKNRGFDWVWLGVWERNFKAQKFYFGYGFERFSQHDYITGETVDTDWLLKKPVKEIAEK